MVVSINLFLIFGTAVILDPCENFPETKCSDICQVENSEAVCSCNVGYKLATDNMTCIDINECDAALNTNANTTLNPNRCSKADSCLNNVGGYTCSCSVGFVLDNDLRTCTACDAFHYGTNCAMECSCGVGVVRCDPNIGCVCLDGWSGTKCDVDRDECSTSTNPCTAANTECVNIPGSHTCPCLTGYTNTSGECADIDECSSTTLNDCSQLCNNTMGNYTCSCNPGFQQNGSTCTDIDECSSQNDCSQGCANTVGSYRCTCPTGYRLLSTDMKTCIAETECNATQTTACGDNSVCAIVNSNPECTCLSGYEMNTTISLCVDINECAVDPSPCSQNCSEVLGGFTCECVLDGYQLGVDGRTCLVCVEGTYGDDCSQTCACTTANTMSCNPVNGTCSCYDGWEGATCGTNINECNITSIHNCPMFSNCVDSDGSFSCQCNDGYSMTADGICQECDGIATYGRDCATTCTCVTANTETCDKVNGTCTCNPGWNGTTCNSDIDECDKSPCTHRFKDCHNTNGSYKCVCQSGLNIDDQLHCIDIDECSEGTHTCTQQCTNTYSNYRCSCFPGYSGMDNDCTVCANGTWGEQCANTCTCDATNTMECSKATGCTCKPFWTGVDCTEDIDECTAVTHNCSANSRCVNKVAGFDCVCMTGYSTSNNNDCIVCVEETYGDDCNQTCACNTTNTMSCDPVNGMCSCYDGWEGDTCDTNIDECLTQSIHNCPTFSSCVDSDGSFSCQCNDGYSVTADGVCQACSGNTYGNECAESCNCTDANTKSSQQSCNHVTGVCDCNAFWAGTQCEADVDECKAGTSGCDSMANRGCHNTFGGFQCFCFVGYVNSSDGICVQSQVTTTTYAPKGGENAARFYISLNYTIPDTDDITMNITYHYYTGEIRASLLEYYRLHMGDTGVIDVIIYLLSCGSVNVNYTVVVPETSAAAQKLSQATMALATGATVEVLNTTTTALAMAVGTDPVDLNTISQQSLLCSVYVQTYGQCLSGFECIVDTGVPTCQPIKTDDDFGLVIGLSVGIPLFFLTMLLVAVIIIYAKRVKRRSYSSDDRSSYKNGFFPTVMPTKIDTGYGIGGPVSGPHIYDEESSSVSSDDRQRRIYRRREFDNSRMGEMYTYDNQKTNFSWDFMYNYIDPNEKYEIRRPQLESDPHPVFTGN